MSIKLVYRVLLESCPVTSRAVKILLLIRFRIQIQRSWSCTRMQSRSGNFWTISLDNFPFLSEACGLITVILTVQWLHCFRSKGLRYPISSVYSCVSQCMCVCLMSMCIAKNEACHGRQTGQASQTSHRGQLITNISLMPGFWIEG